jgi:hypothetical protein
MKSRLQADNRGQCIYCGRQGPTTSDHVPPKTLFPSPLPKNLITVPACRECNSAFSKDDEFFRLVLVIDEKTKGNPAREALVPAVKRSLARFRGQGLASALWSSTQSVERITAEGLYAGAGTFFTMDGKRLDRILTRIAEGLYFHEFGHRVPQDHATSVIHPQKLGMVDLVLREGISEFIAATRSEPEHCFGPAFSYWILRSPNGPQRAHFLLKFYGSQECYAQVQPRAFSDTERAEATEELKNLYREKGWIPPDDL